MTRSTLIRTLVAIVATCCTLQSAERQTANPSAPPPTLSVPDGFGVSVFATGLVGARLMAVSPEGILVVAQRARVVALPDADRDGQAEPAVLVSDLPYAHSVAFGHGYLYIATTPAILRVRWVNGATVGTPETIATLPSATPSLHTSRTLRVGPDGRLYVTMGSSCNACVEPDARRTTMQVMDADGGHARLFAAGLRNTVGFDWDPASGRLWGGDAGVDTLGDETPPEEINLIEDGRHYGHPFRVGANTPNPLPAMQGVTEPPGIVATPPVVELPAHMTPMGVAFYTGTRFPDTYRASLYVALHGSSDRRTKTGYKVVRLPMANGRPGAAEDFLTGFLEGEIVHGRPVGVVTGADGALYVSDDRRGFVYRVFARDRQPGAQARVLVTHAAPPVAGPIQMQVVEVSYEPGGWSAPHQHTCPVVGYVLQGAVRMQLAGRPERVYRAGDTFTELPTDVHAVSANASDTEPARFLAYFACGGDGARTVPVTHPARHKPGAQEE